MDKIYTHQNNNFFVYEQFDRMSNAILSPDLVAQYDKQYRIQNYKGNFSLKLKINEFNSEYQLYYKDTLFNACTISGYTFPITMQVLCKHTHDKLFEHKIHQHELVEFWQYILWDNKNSQQWFMTNFNKENALPNTISIFQYNGSIAIHHFQPLNILSLCYQDIRIQWLSSSPINAQSLKYIVLLGMHSETKESCDLRNLSYNYLAKDFINLKAHILGSSDELLESWINASRKNKNNIMVFSNG